MTEQWGLPVAGVRGSLTFTADDSFYSKSGLSPLVGDARFLRFSAGSSENR
jgi:hypothetical protein